jgi:uncharacterized phage protein gp47/JayE
MAFKKSFNNILTDLLTSYQNQMPDIDISKGSPVYIKSAALASALWGLYNEGEYVDLQRFADSCDRETLEHYIAIRGMSFIPAETDAALRARVLDDIRHPPAGGNKYDYIRWAKEASPLVKNAWCVPSGQGAGTIDVIVLADAAATGSEIPTSDLLAAVRAYIVDICPADVRFLRVLAAELIVQAVTIARIGSDYVAASAIADITAYLAGMEPGISLYRDQLKLLALGGGPGSAPVTTPAADVIPTAYQMLRPGVIDVH